MRKIFNGRYLLKFSSQQLADFSIVLANERGEELVVGYDKTVNEYYIDRNRAGKKNFEIGFAKKHTSARISKSDGMDLTLVVDVGSVELFADDGLTVMTDIFFPNQTMDRLSLKSVGGMKINNASISKIEGIWK
jgi:fructan beta-fructosidase